MIEMTHTPRTPTTAKVLMVTGLVMLLAWVFLNALLPWWASALMLAGAAIASLEAVAIARGGERDE